MRRMFRKLRLRTLAVSATFACLHVVTPACDCGTPPPVLPPPTPLPPSVTVVAGTVGRGVADGVGADARFDSPAGLAVSPDGATAYLADTFVGTVRKVDIATGATTTILGAPFELASIDGTGVDARFASPRGLAVSPDGTILWVGDGASLRRVDLATLDVETVAGDQQSPGDVDATGLDARFEFLLHDLEDDGSAVYATDRGNDKVKRIDTTTFEVTTIATGFSTPGGLTRDGTILYVADTFAGRVVSLDVAAADPQATLAVVASGLDDPQGVELMPSDGGALWTLGFSAVVERIDVASGDVTAVFAGNPAGPTVDGVDEAGGGNLGGAFASLAAVDGGAAAVFVDLTSSALRKVARDGGGDGIGNVVTIAGPETPFGRIDGPGADAKFESPFSVTATRDGGTFFVADTFNHAVRAVDVTRSGDTLSYTVRTVVGRGVQGDVDGEAGDARFAFPVGLALDEDNALLYVADSGNSKIRIIELTGLDNAGIAVPAEERTKIKATVVRTLAGSGESGGDDGDAQSATFADPWDVALDTARGHLYVADSSGNTVRRVDTATGDVSTVLGFFGDNDHKDGAPGTTRIRVPVGVALAGAPDGDGRFPTLYVSDFEAHTIRALDIETFEVTTVHGEDGFPGFAEGEAEFALLSSPSGLSAAPDGSALFVAETGSHVVRRIGTETHGSRFIVGKASLGSGQGTGRALSYEEATLLSPEDVATAAHAAGVVDLIVLSDHGVVHAVSIPE